MAKDFWETILAPKRNEKITASSYLKPYIMGLIIMIAVIGFLTYNDTIKMGNPTGAVTVEPTGNLVNDITQNIIPPEKNDSSQETNSSGNSTS